MLEPLKALVQKYHPSINATRGDCKATINGCQIRLENNYVSIEVDP
jgi:hypothetical protein